MPQGDTALYGTIRHYMTPNCSHTAPFGAGSALAQQLLTPAARPAAAGSGRRQTPTPSLVWVIVTLGAGQGADRISRASSGGLGTASSWVARAGPGPAAGPGGPAGFG